jgi:hypothetical protein
MVIKIDRFALERPHSHGNGNYERFENIQAGDHNLEGLSREGGKSEKKGVSLVALTGIELESLDRVPVFSCLSWRHVRVAWTPATLG